MEIFASLVGLSMLFKPCTGERRWQGEGKGTPLIKSFEECICMLDFTSNKLFGISTWSAMYDICVGYVYSHIQVCD